MGRSLQTAASSVTGHHPNSPDLPPTSEKKCLLVFCALGPTAHPGCKLLYASFLVGKLIRSLVFLGPRYDGRIIHAWKYDNGYVEAP